MSNPFKKEEAKAPIEKVEVKEAREIKGPTTIVAAVPEDIYIAQMVQGQPSTLAEIEARDVEMPQEGKHRLTLPDEIEKLFKKRNVAPRWILKTKRGIDNAVRQRGWVLATKVYFPELSDEFFSATGVIENGDSILAFMPEKQAAVLRAIPQKQSLDKTRNLPIDAWKTDAKGEKYYKPDLSTKQDEKDGEVVSSEFQG